MPARAPNHFGYKPYLYGILRPHFTEEANRNRLLSTVLGSASEQWINCECFQAIRLAIPEIAVRPEWKKRDIAFFASREDEKPISIIETKVLYANYSLEKQIGQLRALAEQMRGAERMLDPSHHRNSVGGLMVWFDWQWTDLDTDDGGRPRAKNTRRRGRFPSREQVRQSNLENAFSGGHQFTIRGPVEQARVRYDVTARFEMLRLIG